MNIVGLRVIYKLTGRVPGVYHAAIHREGLIKDSIQETGVPG